ncbi:Ser/Thr protein phosphatase family protein, expressed [Quillaja saponaria]|uniref:Ser/Thr protein phosphatase family protein, expressed n=1 Tax=Quillaja saponaria TaxID=32244 RepID=A0AAD7Q6N1_QUISA|nr:Ser/Thr protein phosphatase family protein, expressed [Quillaja saponaria]
MVLGLNPSCLTLHQQPSHSNNYFGTLSKYGRNLKRSDIRRPQILPSVSGPPVGLRVFVLSDLHTDYTDNMKWDRYQHVFYVPGNHDLWCRHPGEDYVDSLEKMNKLLDSFDKEKDITGIRIPSLEMACKDFHACKWPEGLSNGDTSLAFYFDALNDRSQNLLKEIQDTCHHTITFSHFVPRQELCPEKRMLFYPKLPKIIGSDCLEVRIRSIHGLEGKEDSSACHVFGHTHFCWDAMVDGIRYVQAPLAYPRERKRRMNGGENWLPFCLYADGKFTDRLSPCYWSDYYSVQPQDTS